MLPTGEQIPIVLVMADYSVAVPLWLRDGSPNQRLPDISTDLARELRAWCAIYDDNALENSWDALEPQFVQRGYDLAGRLARELHGRFRVECFDESLGHAVRIAES